MSISPFQPDDRPLQNWQSATRSQKEGKSVAPLTLSQALTITAGLAGLIGLISGVVIRFSLSNSSNARFLSPLQTFPALSDWAPELPQKTADSHYLPAGTPRDTWESSTDSDGLPVRQDEVLFDSEQPTSSEDFAGLDFDSFANRTETSESRESGDPWEVLRNGPRLSEREFEDDFSAEDGLPANSADNEQPVYDEDGYSEERYSEDGYEEEAPYDDPYADESYEEAPYEEPYVEQGYENYFDDSEPFINQSDGDRYEE